MKELFTYLLASALWSGILWGFYISFLRKETFFHFNRIFLLLGLLLIATAPLLRFHYSVSDGRVSEIVAQSAATLESINSVRFAHILLYCYAAVATCIVVRYCFLLGRVGRIIKKYGADKIIHTPDFKTSFSLFGYVFMDSSRKVPPMEKEMVLQHELAHIGQYHWIDLLAAHILCVFQWFNPFAWLYLKAIRQNHEFLADAAVVEIGHSKWLYRAAIINDQLGANVCSFAHSFSHHRVNRIFMIGRSPSHPLKKTVVLLLLPLLGLFCVAFAQPVYQITPPSANEQMGVYFRASGGGGVIPNNGMASRASGIGIDPKVILVNRYAQSGRVVFRSSGSVPDTFSAPPVGANNHPPVGTRARFLFQSSANAQTR